MHRKAKTEIKIEIRLEIIGLEDILRVYQRVEVTIRQTWTQRLESRRKFIELLEGRGQNTYRANF